MHQDFLALLRCPFCGTRFSVVENEALQRRGAHIESCVLGCECCAFPVVAGIPVLIADDVTREAMHALEAGDDERALSLLLGLDDTRLEAFRALIARGGQATYRDALDVLCLDAEGACFLYRFSDPTFVMIEAIVQAIGAQRWPLAGRCLDLCGGTGHLTRLLNGLQPAGGVVVADLFFWKLWMARRFMVPSVPGASAVCCDANAPLPFVRESFSFQVLSDAFPYIWHKRLVADEMVRLSTEDGVVLMPHLHSALGENFSAGDTLTPAAYQDLFARQQPRLFSDVRLFAGVLEGAVDLTQDVSPNDLGSEPSLTLLACRRAGLFQHYSLPGPCPVSGELAVNPLYQIDRQEGVSTLTLRFPTPEYAEEFAECRRYLPETITLDGDLTRPIDPSVLGARYEEFRRRRIVIDAPPRYC